MNQPADQKTPRYVTCRCQHCDGHIEFDANEFTEDNSIVPCPHCGLETKIFIPASQTEKVSTELPPSVASPNAVRREGFFCGGGEPIPAQVSAEQPATEGRSERHPLGSAPELTEDQIKSVGERQNDGMAVNLYHEGDQDMAMSLDDARRYIADPRFKLINPETGLRFTPATLEAFIKSKRLEEKTENSKVELTEGQINKIWRKCYKLKKEINKSRAKWMEEGERVTLTSAQCEIPIVQELIGLLIEIEKDGFINDHGAHRLNEWLEPQFDSEIPAFYFLLDTSRLVLANGKLTARTVPDIMIAMELQLAIERVLPKHLREPIVAKRLIVEGQLRCNAPASQGVYDYIRRLGGKPSREITAVAAYELKEKLYHQPTEKQLEYIRALGVNPPSDLTRYSAIDLIDKLLHPVNATDRQLQHIRDLGGNPSAELTHTDAGTKINTSHFTIVELQQGTTEWRKWRHNGIGASDASTIMGENRFKSAVQLLQEKRGPAQDYGQNAAMAHGTELEPEARRLYVAKTGREVRPACLQSTRYDWLRASLDGLAINHDAVVEIKCGQSAYRTTSQTRSVPDYYYGQMQHILAVTGLDSLDFWCYWPGCPTLLIPVARNVAYIERLLNRELEFWNLIQQNVS
jgi:putative phage-type endonuclease